jgi:CRISPR system Cascade subunit CasB
LINKNEEVTGLNRDNTVSAKHVETYTARRIAELLSMSKENTRFLAELRRGIGKAPGELPQLWGYFLEVMPEEFYGAGEPSRAEWAVYIALTMFALHQQGKDPVLKPMQKNGQSLGSALACLVHDPDNRVRIARRFNVIATASSMEEVSHYLRGAIQLLRGEDIGLDYSKLAKDLYCFQFPEMVSGVRLQWGQDFYRKHEDEKMEEENGLEEVEK